MKDVQMYQKVSWCHDLNPTGSWPFWFKCFKSQGSLKTIKLWNHSYNRVPIGQHAQQIMPIKNGAFGDFSFNGVTVVMWQSSSVATATGNYSNFLHVWNR